jgi:hypothetical protein
MLLLAQLLQAQDDERSQADYDVSFSLHFHGLYQNDG